MKIYIVTDNEGLAGVSSASYISPAFENTVIALREEQLENCKNAKSLLLRCVLFPLYPRLGKNQSSKIAKVLATLP